MTFHWEENTLAEVFRQPGGAAEQHPISQGAALPKSGLSVSPGRLAIPMHS